MRSPRKAHFDIRSFVFSSRQKILDWSLRLAMHTNAAAKATQKEADEPAPAPTGKSDDKLKEKGFRPANLV